MVEQIAKLSEQSDADDPVVAAAEISAQLNAYSGRLRDWAREIAAKMIVDVSDADYQAWLKVGKNISNATRRMLSSDSVGDVFQRLQDEEVELITSLPREAAEKVHEWTKEGLARGDRYEQIAQRIRDELGPVTKTRAICIARTETARARTNFTQARARNVGSPGYYWRTVEDGRVRPMHRKLNGTFHLWTEPPACDVGRGGVPLHAHPGGIFNCFPGETLVEVPSDLVRVIRAPFNGRVVDIRCAGSLITATPNHPMLTARGWVKASELNEGDYLLKPFGDAVERIEADKDRTIASLEELFEAFSSEAVASSGVLFDFYGDRPDGDVDTAIVQPDLLTDIKPKLSKCVRDFRLSGAAAVVRGVLHDALDMRRSGGFRQTAALFKGGARHADAHRLASGANGDAVLLKPRLDGAPSDAEGLRESQDTFSGLVTADDLGGVEFFPVYGAAPSSPEVRVYAARPKDLRKMVSGDVDASSRFTQKSALLYQGQRVQYLGFRDFCGHVYTLETVKGWYRVGGIGIVARNCRCWAAPIFPEDMEIKKK